MADNIQLDAGSGGSVLAADDISSVFYQRVKVVWGVDGSQVDTSETDPLPVNMHEIAGTAIALGGGVEAGALLVTLASDSTGLLSVDDNGGSLTIDNAALSVTGGGVEASALRVTLASDSTGVLTVDNAGTFATQATLQAGTAEIGKLAAGVASIGTVGLDAGTNAIGKLAANSGVDIGDVDVTSLVMPRVTSSVSEKTAVPASSTSTPIVAANADRKSCLLYNAGTDDVEIGVGESATANMIPILAGQYLAVEGTGAINGFNDGSASADIHYLDEAWV